MVVSVERLLPDIYSRTTLYLISPYNNGGRKTHASPETPPSMENSVVPSQVHLPYQQGSSQMLLPLLLLLLLLKHALTDQP